MATFVFRQSDFVIMFMNETKNELSNLLERNGKFFSPVQSKHSESKRSIFTIFAQFKGAIWSKFK